MAILHLFYSQQSENKEKIKRKQKVIQNDITTGKNKSLHTWQPRKITNKYHLIYLISVKTTAFLLL